jgi:hypothetical protein
MMCWEGKESFWAQAVLGNVVSGADNITFPAYRWESEK